MSHHWLHLRLAGPLVSFGGVAIDQVGPTRDFPSASMLTGLVANALGLRREDATAHQELQDRLVFGAVIKTEGVLLTDVQNAELEKSDSGWTTWGTPEKRDGGVDTYRFPHRRRRDFLADHDCRVVLRLTGEGRLSTDDLAAALECPARPLFIGRKPCLPVAPVLVGRVEGRQARDALMALARTLGFTGRAIWPDDGERRDHTHKYNLADLRNWRSGLHGGLRIVVEGTLP